MASQVGVALQEKVSRMLSREKGKPVLKSKRPLAVQDHVTNRKSKRGEAKCITEMSVLMACWKQNNFVDALCSDQVKVFFSCVEADQAARTAPSQQVTSHAGELLPHQVNTLLKRFPNVRSET